MQITRENTGDLTATLKLEIVPEDYLEAFQKSLKDFQRKANIPGFRPGKVPTGMIKKMYGKGILAEEVNKLLTNHLSKYIEEEKLDLLGNPLANREKVQEARFEDGESFEFYFDIAYSPEFDLALNSDLEVEKYRVIIEDNLVDSYVTESRKRHGNYLSVDQATDGDMLSGKLIEVDDDRKPIENGYGQSKSIFTDSIKNPDVKEQFMHMIKGAKLTFKPIEFFGSDKEAARILGIPEKKLSKPGFTVSFILNDITHIIPAELTPELFQNVYPDEQIETEEAFRERIRKDASGSLVSETDKLLFRDIVKLLVSNTPLNLPDEFLKRWLLDQDDNKLTAEEMETHYPAFAESMKWQLIENRIIKEFNLQVTEEDIRNYIRAYLVFQSKSDETDPETDKRLDSVAETIMKSEEQVKKISDQLYHLRLMDTFKANLTIREKEISYTDFMVLAAS